MGKKIALFALWVVGSLVAIAVVSQGVRLIDDQVAAEQPAIDLAGPPEGADVTEATEMPTTTVSPGTATTLTTNSEPASTTVLPSANPTQPALPTVPPTPAPTTPLATVAPSASAGSTPTVAPAPAATTTTTIAPAAAQVLTFNLVGGSTAISFSPTKVFAVWATPNSGFTVEIKPNGEGSTTVEFRSDDHRSRIDARWDGAPSHEIREEGDD